ncbi:MAG TPA: YciI family protein [Mycobacteriales bacterium]|nr:YciI family protein [Mycobacteriales bacterium]
MSTYMLLIYGDEQEWSKLTGEQWTAHGEAHGAFVAAAGARVVGAGQLTPAPGATTVRSGPSGEVFSTDGPFAETKEAVGGYYLLDCSDVSEVIELASILPEAHAGHSGIEIRELVQR